jgi:hypothetical protein
VARRGCDTLNRPIKHSTREAILIDYLTAVDEISGSCSSRVLNAVILSRKQTNDIRSLNGRFFTYVLVDGNNYLYAGYTSNPYQRFMMHKQGYAFHAVLMFEHDSESNARLSEREIISQIEPLYNKQFTGEYDGDRGVRTTKIIKGKRVQVKYKAFRLPLDFIKELNAFAVKEGEPLENIAYKALFNYVIDGK